MSFLGVGYYSLNLDFLLIFLTFFDLFFTFFQFFSFLGNSYMPLLFSWFFSIFDKFLNSELFFEKHIFFDFQLFQHYKVFCKSTSFSLFFCSDLRFRREIAISPAGGWGKDCRKINTQLGT